MSHRRFVPAVLLLALTFSISTTSAAYASTIIDLTSGGSGTSNGAWYEWTDFGPTGTGVMNTFLRVQNRGTEQGYNHDASNGPGPWDTKAGIHTHDIQYQDLVTKTILGQDYFEFLLDINESNGHDNEYLSLDNVQIFTRSTPITDADESLDHLGDQRFNMDAGPNGDTTVVLNYNLNPGSGGGDMFMYVPVSLFAGTMPEDYVYFYSAFGNLYSSDAGFEEWGMRIATSGGGGPIENTPVPEPGSMFLLGSGLLFAARRFSRTA